MVSLGSTCAGSESCAPSLKTSGTLIMLFFWTGLALFLNIDLWKLFALRIEQEARFDFTENNSYQSTMGTSNEAISAPCTVLATSIVHPHEHQRWVIVRNLHIEKPGVKSPQTTWPHLYQMVEDVWRGRPDSETYGTSIFSADDNSESHSSSWHPGVIL